MLNEVNIDAVIIGGGAIGLSVAAQLPARYRSIVVLEQDNLLGNVLSSRNSGVVHAGLYYKNLPLKQKFCIEGNKILNELISQNLVRGARCGKFLVGSGSNVALLNQIYSNAKEIGLDLSETKNLSTELFDYEYAL